MTTTLASTSEFIIYSGQNKVMNNNKSIIASSAGAYFQYTSAGNSDTIVLPQALVEATGNVLEVMSSRIITPEDSAQILDELDLEIALMSDQEVLNAVLSFEGVWADRDDLDGIMDRRDRIDELYASNNPNETI